MTFGLLNGPPGDSANCASWPPRNEHQDAHCHNRLTIACTIVRRFVCGDFRMFNRADCPVTCFCRTACDRQTACDSPASGFECATAKLVRSLGAAKPLQSYAPSPNLAVHLTGMSGCFGATYIFWIEVASLIDIFKSERQSARNAGLFHRHTIQDVGDGHGGLAMGDHDELCRLLEVS